MGQEDKHREKDRPHDASDNESEPFVKRVAFPAELSLATHRFHVTQNLKAHSMAIETATQVSLDFLANQAKLKMKELRHIRKDMTEMIRLVTESCELTRRVERRQSELRDDIELAVKMEFGGALANIQTLIGNSLSGIEDNVAGVAERVTHLENKL